MIKKEDLDKLVGKKIMDYVLTQKGGDGATRIERFALIFDDETSLQINATTCVVRNQKETIGALVLTTKGDVEVF